MFLSSVVSRETTIRVLVWLCVGREETYSPPLMDIPLQCGHQHHSAVLEFQSSFFLRLCQSIFQEIVWIINRKWLINLWCLNTDPNRQLWHPKYRFRERVNKTNKQNNFKDFQHTVKYVYVMLLNSHDRFLSSSYSLQYCIYAFIYILSFPLKANWGCMIQSNINSAHCVYIRNAFLEQTVLVGF